MDALQISDQQPGMFNASFTSPKRAYSSYPVSRDPLVVLHSLPRSSRGKVSFTGIRVLPQLVLGGVQRDCQAHSEPRSRKFKYAGDYPGGRDRDMPDPEVSHAGIVQHPHRFQHGLGVEERLSHAHVYEIAYITPDGFLHGKELSRYLPGGEVPYITRKAGRAERASERASHLGGDAGRKSLSLPHEHGFDALSVPERKGIFSCRPLRAAPLSEEEGKITFSTRASLRDFERFVISSASNTRFCQIH